MENIKKEELERAIFEYLKDNLFIKSYKDYYGNETETHLYLIDPTSKEQHLIDKFWT